MAVHGIIGFGWPFAPMHLRGAEFTLTDTMSSPHQLVGRREPLAHCGPHGANTPLVFRLGLLDEISELSLGAEGFRVELPRCYYFHPGVGAESAVDAA